MKLLKIIFVLMFLISAATGQTSNNSAKQDGTPVIASVPRTMTYQGILKNADGEGIPDSFFDVTFRIYDTEYGGTESWIESFFDVATDGKGLFSVGFSNVNLAFDEDYWLELEIEGEILSHRQKINMSAYAARADTSDYAIAGAGWVDDGSSIRLEDAADNVGIGIPTPSYKLDVLGDIHTYEDVISESNISAVGNISALNGYIAAGSSISAATSMTAGTNIIAGQDISASGTISSPYIETGIIDALNISATGNIDAAGVQTGSFQMTSGAASGYVLTSDATGNGSWQPAGGGIGGTGTANYLSKFYDTDQIGNSQIYDNGTNIGIGLTSPESKLDVHGDIHTYGVITSDLSVHSNNLVADNAILSAGWLQANGDIITLNNMYADSITVNSLGASTGTISGSLDVAGDITTSALTTGTLDAASVDVSGDVYSSGVNASSIHAYGDVTADNDVTAAGNLVAGGNISAYYGSLNAGVNVNAAVNISAGLDITAGRDITGEGIYVGAFHMPIGASSGYVLTSDGSGNGTWQALPGSVDGELISNLENKINSLMTVVETQNEKIAVLEARIADLGIEK